MHKMKKRMDEKKERMRCEHTHTCRAEHTQTESKDRHQVQSNHDTFTTTVSRDDKVPTQWQRRKQRRKHSH